MKTKLLYLFFLFNYLCFSQTPINDYFSLEGDQFAIVTGVVDQSSSGANSTWSFSSLTQTGTNTDTYAAPTSGETISYPGTTQVLTITDNVMNSSEIFYKADGSSVTLTGTSNSQFVLDYNTDNAFLGSYPLTFGTTATTDAIAGTITTGGQSALYSGTITTEVDAYGLLNFNVTGQGSYSGSVTRVKTQQLISFTVLGVFPGTGLITSYNYYKDTDGVLVFRTTDGVVSVPSLGINQTITSREALITNTLSLFNNVLANNSIKFYPNPFKTHLNIEVANGIIVTSISVFDTNGRVVLYTKSNLKLLDVSKLHAGLYFAKFSTNKGLVTKKVLKK